MSRYARAACAFATLLVLLTGSEALAADLRIETRVYAADEEAPISHSDTFFSDGVVYDFRDAESRVTIYRPAVGESPARFVLLDTRLEQQTEVPIDKIAQAMNKLRRWAAMQEDPFLRFTGAPRFEETFDQATGELKLTSDQLSYRVVTKPLKNPESRVELRGFLDGFAQLHTLLEAGLPPEPRLHVNEALSRHGVVPLQVELTARDDDEPSLRAEHVVDTVLSKPDRLRIDEALNRLTSYKRVSNAEFQRGRKERVAAKP